MLIDIERFLFAHGDTSVLCLHLVYSTVHSREIMDSLIMAKYCKCILTVGCLDVTECKYRYLVHDYSCSIRCRLLAKNVSFLCKIAEL